MTNTEPELALRNLPTQARSKETFDRILTESGLLLEEVGFDAFTTNLLSKRSGVGVRAIYRYFPNKFSLVCELARRLELQWEEALESVSNESQEVEWAELWLVYLDRYIEAVAKTPGGVAILRAMRSNPQLRVIDDEMNRTYQSNISKELRKRYSNLTSSEAKSICIVLMQTTVAVVDASLDENRKDAARLINHLKTMHLSLLQKNLT